MTTDQPATTPQLSYALEYLFSYEATLQPPEVIGPVPEGIRVNAYVTGGQVWGPRLRGTVRPVGADWITIGRDGVARLDVRITLEAEDGALLYVTYTGVLDLGEDGYEGFLRGELPADPLPIRTAPRVQTAHPAYQWLQRIQCIGVGESLASQGRVRFDVYAVR
jgi:hypothetical protein